MYYGGQQQRCGDHAGTAVMEMRDSAPSPSDRLVGHYVAFRVSQYGEAARPPFFFISIFTHTTTSTGVNVARWTLTAELIVLLE